MTSPDAVWFTPLFGIVLLGSVLYAAGRLHQWYRQSWMRDEAFREGYDQATRSLFSLATRGRAQRDQPQDAVVRPIETAPSARQARHRAEDRMAVTRVLNADEYGRRSA